MITTYHIYLFQRERGGTRVIRTEGTS